MLDIPDYFHVFDLNTHDQPLVVYEEELKVYVAELTKKKFVTNYLTLAMMNGVLDTKETYTLAQKASTSDGLTSLYVHLLQKISEIPVESEVIRKVDILIRNKH